MSVTTVVLLSVGLGLIAGWTCGDEVRRRKNAEAKVEDLRQHLQHACSGAPTQERQLKEMRSILNDAHKHILAVSKGLKNPPAKPHKIKGRISSIRPFHKVWVKKQRLGGFSVDVR